MEQGLAQAGGSPSVYREVLALYREDVEKRLAFLDHPPDREELPLFIIQIHALKSASANIGAAVLSGQASALEEAGLRGDLAAIGNLLEEFRTNLAAMTGRIRSAFPPETSGPKEVLPPAEQAALTRLRQALETGDLVSINRLLGELEKEQLGPASRGALASVSECILVYELERAIRILDGIPSLRP
jgi:HPt (histidine-containing phosphotransfer) domain-containing protein